MINAKTESGAETSPNALDHQYTNLAPILPHTPVHSTGHSSCMSTWATTGSFSAQHLVEYHEEIRSHEALTYDHGGTIGT